MPRDRRFRDRACTVAVVARQEPTSRLAAQAVALEFFASGPDGVVFDLRADELTLKVNGRTRQPDTAKPASGS